MRRTSVAEALADDSFRISQVRSGTGTPVYLANGFLSEHSEGWGRWRRLVDGRYPDAPVYRVSWGAKEKRDFAEWLKRVGWKEYVLTGARRGPVESIGAALVHNPWIQARNRAELTGFRLARVLERRPEPTAVLVGFSLGGSVMANAAAMLTDTYGPRRLETVHLLGAALANKSVCGIGGSVTGLVHNYYSRSDDVLRWLFRSAEFGRTPVGLKGFRSDDPRIVDHDMTGVVPDHHGHFEHVELV